MDASASWPVGVDYELACSRSRRRAAARRVVSVRRAALQRRALRTLAFVVLAAVGFAVGATDVESFSANSSIPAGSSAAGRTSTCGIPAEFAGAFRAASLETGVPLPLLAAVAWEESRMDPGAVSAAGARGLLQLMPETAKLVAVGKNTPGANVLAGARYLRLMIDRFHGDVELALAAYNAGPTAVEEAGAAPSIGTLRYAKNVELRAASLTACA